MGTRKTAIWVALFALIANAGSGLGLELARPADNAQMMTVCETQSAITTMLAPSRPAAAPDIRRLQLALDLAENTEETVTDSDPSLLFGAVFPDRTPVLDAATLGANFALQSLIDRPEVDSNTRNLLDFALPPGSPHIEQSLHTLLTPNGPPALV